MIENIIDKLNHIPILFQFTQIVGVIALGLAAYSVLKLLIIRALYTAAKVSRFDWDDIILKNRVFHRLSLVAPAVIIYNFAAVFGEILDVHIRRIMLAWILWIGLRVIDALLRSINQFYEENSKYSHIPIKSYTQIVKIVVYVLGLIVMVAILLGQSPMLLLSGVGAMTAVLLFVFRDTILSFTASLQISAYDLVKVGDWIEVPKFGADGDVIDIALHTVKVQNWDRTISVIPTHKLLEDSFKNWRGMTQGGGRRIKRSILLDMFSVKFCDDEMLERLSRIDLVSNYVKERQREIDEDNKRKGVDVDISVNGRRQTNVGIFRQYVSAYLRNHPKIHQEMTCIVRQLPLTENGLPLEIYVFTNETAWANYESIQSDIFDHMLAATKEFDLQVFQHPSGQDIRSLHVS